MAEKITLQECLDFLGVESTPEINDMVQGMMDGIYSSLYIATGYDVSETEYNSKVENMANTILKLELYNDYNNQSVRQERITYLIKQLQVLINSEKLEEI